MPATVAMAFSQDADSTVLANSGWRTGDFRVQGNNIGHQSGGYRPAGQETREVGQPHKSGESYRNTTGRIGVTLRISQHLILLDGI